MELIAALKAGSAIGGRKSRQSRWQTLDTGRVVVLGEGEKEVVGNHGSTYNCWKAWGIAGQT